MKLHENWIIYETHYFANCGNCGKEIRIKPFLQSGAKEHVNIAQNPPIKYFCSDTCKLEFSLTK